MVTAKDPEVSSALLVIDLGEATVQLSDRLLLLRRQFQVELPQGSGGAWRCSAGMARSRAQFGSGSATAATRTTARAETPAMQHLRSHWLFVSRIIVLGQGEVNLWRMTAQGECVRGRIRDG